MSKPLCKAFLASESRNVIHVCAGGRACERICYARSLSQPVLEEVCTGKWVIQRLQAFLDHRLLSWHSSSSPGSRPLPCHLVGSTNRSSSPDLRQHKIFSLQIFAAALAAVWQISLCRQLCTWATSEIFAAHVSRTCVRQCRCHQCHGLGEVLSPAGALW